MPNSDNSELPVGSDDLVLPVLDDTTEVDAFAFDVEDHNYLVVSADLARRLLRERNEARREAESARRIARSGLSVHPDHKFSWENAKLSHEEGGKEQL